MVVLHPLVIVKLVNHNCGKKAVINMQISRWAWLIIGNAALGLFTCYASIFLWITDSGQNTDTFFSVRTGLGFIIGFVVYIIWNYFMLKMHHKKYWIHSITTFLGTIILFFFMFQFV